MPRIWEQHVREGTMLAGIVEDPLRARDDRLLFFGISAFVTDAFFEECLARPEPHVAARVYRGILAGRSPVLTREALARANTRDGLSLVILHNAMKDYDLSKPSVEAVVGASRDLGYLVHHGYRMKGFLLEAYGAAFKLYYENAGFVLHADHADYYRRHRGAPSPDRIPFLMALRKDQGAAGSNVWHFFLFREPRLGLPPAEQDVLFRAVLNESDEEIAAALAISLDTVHKHWRAIYLRVWDAAPELLPGTQSPDGQSQRRGPEKRRHLLEYVRVHLEELRPYCHDRRRQPRRVRASGVDFELTP
jgi:DNA-binding CsgD family transcriptional regulator